MVGMARSVKLIMYCEIASSSSVSPFFISCGRHQEISGGDARARRGGVGRGSGLTPSEAREGQGFQTLFAFDPSIPHAQTHHIHFERLKKVKFSVVFRAKPTFIQPCTYMGGILKPWHGHHDVDVCLMSAF